MKKYTYYITMMTWNNIYTSQCQPAFMSMARAGKSI